MDSLRIAASTIAFIALGFAAIAFLKSLRQTSRRVNGPRLDQLGTAFKAAPSQLTLEELDRLIEAAAKERQNRQ